MLRKFKHDLFFLRVLFCRYSERWPVFRKIWVIFILLVTTERAYPASFIMQFQGIEDFRAENFFQMSYYNEIRSFLVYSVEKSYYNFCVEPESTCIFGYADISPAEFTHPVRVVLPFTLIREALLRYSSKIKKEFSSSSFYEVVPEFKEGVRDIPDKIIFDATLKDLRIRRGIIVKDYPDGTSCFQKFPHHIVADISLEVSASVGGGKDVFVDVYFSIPITVDAIIWVPDVRRIYGERELKRSTLYVVFGRCGYRIYPDFYFENLFSPRRVIDEIKRKKENIQGKIDFDRRFGVILSYVIEAFLAELDFRPIVFPIITLALADIKRSYIVSVDGEEGLAFEFADRGVIGLSTSPSLYIIKSPNKAVSSDFTEIKIEGDSETNDLSFSINGGVWSEWIKKDDEGLFSFIVTDLIQGANTVSVVGRNIFGNINEKPYLISFIVDRTPPFLEVYVPPYSNKIKAEILAYDELVGGDVNVELIVKKNGREVMRKNYSFSGKISISEDVEESGDYVLIFQAKDLCGNSSDSVFRRIMVDKKPPKARVVRVPPSKINVDSIDLLIEIDDDLFPYGVIHYFIEEVVSERRKTCFSVWGTSRSLEVWEPYGYIKLSGFENEKRYHVCIFAKDPAGNSGDVTEFEFFVDRISPKVVINSFPPRITYESQNYVELSAEDNVSEAHSLQIFFDFSSPFFVSRVIRFGGNMKIFFDNLPDGRYKFSAYAIDEAGNASNFEEREFIVDTTLKRIGGGGGIRLGCQSFDISWIIFFLFLPFALRKRIATKR